MLKPYNQASLTQFELFSVEQRRIDKTLSADTLRQRWSDMPEKTEVLKCFGVADNYDEIIKAQFQARRDGVPGAIRRNGAWSRQRNDSVDYHTAQQQKVASNDK